MQSYNTPSVNTTLSAEHRRMLFKESSIDPAVAAERGYSTARSRTELLDFPKYQRRPGLRVPLYSPDGATKGAQIRPHTPRRGKRGKAIKYETAGGSEVILDVHPRMRERVNGGDGDLWLTEGIKKSDALTSHDLPAIGLIGVWNFQRGGELLPCWDHVRIVGRRVYVVYDADVMVNANVQQALERLVGSLEARGAEVLVVYLPGPEKGVDDYLAAGGTVSELKMLAHRFEPQDLGSIRLSRDADLKASVNGMWSRWWSYDWGRLVGTGQRPHYMRGHSCRDALKVLIDEATRSGKLDPDGVRVTMAQSTLALKMASSSRTVWKSLAHLEIEGFLRRDNEGREEGKSGSFVLLAPRASVSRVVGSGAGGEEDSSSGRESDHTDLHLRAPRLRWSGPRFYRENGEQKREHIRRLGKRAGRIIDTLEREGEMHVEEMAEALCRRARDLRRRDLAALEEAGIIGVTDDTVSLAEGWQEALHRERELKGEIAAEERDRGRYRRKSEAFRNRHKHPEDGHWANNPGADGAIEELEPADAPDTAAPDTVPVSDLAAAVRDYLEKNPQDACQPAGWIGVTLWAYGHHRKLDNPPAETRGAIEELGGESYLRSCLRRAGGAAA